MGYITVVQDPVPKEDMNQVKRQMKMIKTIAGCLVTFAIINISACSMPMRIRQITNASEPVKGLRYVVKRPSLAVSLRLDDDVYTRLDTVDKINEATTNCDTDLKFDVIVAQTLSEKFLTYEVTTPSGFAVLPHIFADTRLEVKTEPDGTLLALSAGATDKSLEFIQAIAGLAATVAKKKTIASLADRNYCKMLKTDRFKEYARKHFELLSVAKLLTGQIADLRRGLERRTPSDMLQSLKVIERWTDELSRTNEMSAGLQFPLGSNDYSLSIDGKQLKNPCQAWLDVTLTKN